MTKFLITGGAGFVGSHLAEKLIKDGNQVTVLDDFSTGQKVNLSKTTVKLVEGSIFDKNLVEILISESDQVLHLAAALGVFNIVNKPLESLKTNLQGAEIVLELATKLKSQF